MVASGPDTCPALVLNADFRPLSYLPLSLWNWQDAIKAVFMGRVTILSEYDTEVHSPSFHMKLPSVIALKDYIPVTRRPAFTRFNVFLRDHFTCQYCGDPHFTHDLTFDHAIPRSKGGGTSWENVVAACASCNSQKGNSLPDVCGMHPRRLPHVPTHYELQETGRGFPPNYLHQSWRDYLYWDSELDS